MVEFIFFIIFIISVIVLGTIVYRKLPVLTTLPQNGYHGLKKPEFIAKIENNIKEHHFHFFEKQMFLHHLLSKARIFILKTESKIDSRLQDIRKNAQEVEKKAKRKSKV